MEVIFKIATRELKKMDALSCYNHIVHKIKSSKYSFTHIQEVYDDVNEHPSYEFGIIENKTLKILFFGEGEPIPENKEDTGGVYVEIYIDCPEYLNLNKQTGE